MTLTLTHSAAVMGLVLLCRSLPSVLLGPFIGPLIDHFPKKPVLFITDLIRTVFAFSLSFSILMHMTWILYVGSALLGTSGIFFGPARNSVIPRVVTDDELPVANGIDSQASGLIQIVGAAFGAIVSATIGPIFCFSINALSYLWSAWHIGRCYWDETTATRKERVQYLQSLKIGFQETLHNRVVLSVIIIGISWGLAGGGYYIIVPVLGQQVYHMGGLGIGTLYVIDGIGVLVGAYFVNQYFGKNRRKATIWYGIAYITQAIFFGIMTQFTVFAWGALMLLFMRISSGIIIPLDTYMLQISTDKSIQGRVFSLHSSTYGGVMQLSYAIMGLALSKLGVPKVGVIVGMMSLLCGVAWLGQFKSLYDRIQRNEFI